MNITKEISWKYLLGVFKLKRIVARWYGTRRLDYQGKALTITTTNIREYHTRARSVAKEPETVKWIERVTGPNAVFYDVGANIGAYTLIAASRSRAVIAFEPLPDNIATLHRNILLNRLSNVTVLPFALGKEEGVMQCTIADTSSGASQGMVSGESGMRIPVVTLDAAFELFHLPSPTAIKIDVDGGELEVLSGGAKTLALPTLTDLMLEADDGYAAEALTRLDGAGFTKVSDVRMDKHTVNYFLKRT